MRMPNALAYLVVCSSAALAHADTPTTVTCTSTGERKECTADTSAGVSLERVLGPAPCVLDRTWGYEDDAIWVQDGCTAEFQLGFAARTTTTEQKPIEQWGAVVPGQGFLVGKTSIGTLYVSAYALVRYLNQMPAGQTFVDHLGNVHAIDARDDIFAHRIMVFLKGWIGRPKLIYQIILWTVNTTDQKNLFAVIGYQFHRAFQLYGGLNALPGTRTLLGSHPYWLAPDRVMADEFFRPFFTNGVWASGEPVHGLWYTLMIGNNLSALGITAAQLTRSFAYSGNVWWMPTTGEFGPNGGFDDFDYHDEVATRVGFGATTSHEDRFSSDPSAAPDNTTLRLADSLNVFDTGSLAPGVTVNNVRYRLLSADAGIKYKGVFVGTAVLPALAGRVPDRRPDPGEPDRRQGLLRAGRGVRGQARARAVRCDVVGVRRQARGVLDGARVARRRELVLHEEPRHPAQRAADLRRPVAGQ